MMNGYDDDERAELKRAIDAFATYRAISTQNFSNDLKYP